nr:SAP domain-containing protein [Saprospiraceae bacterium]
MARTKSSKKSTKSPSLTIKSEDLTKLKVAELKAKCTKMGIECKGKKADLIRAIIDAEGRHSISTSSSSISIPTKKASSTKKKPAAKKEKKSPVKMVLSPPRYNYDKMTLPELKKECRKRQLKDPKTRKCPNISKTRLVELLKLWDGMDLPEV